VLIGKPGYRNYMAITTHIKKGNYNVKEGVVVLP
jgi:hypothetical protein